MCCLYTILLLMGPRVAGVIWWIANPVRWVGNTAVSAFDSFLWPMIGLLIVPWTTIMYVIVSPGGVVGWDWLWLGLMFLADISMYAGGGYGNRGQINQYAGRS